MLCGEEGNFYANQAAVARCSMSNIAGDGTARYSVVILWLFGDRWPCFEALPEKKNLNDPLPAYLITWQPPAGGQLICATQLQVHVGMSGMVPEWPPQAEVDEDDAT